MVMTTVLGGSACLAVEEQRELLERDHVVAVAREEIHLRLERRRRDGETAGPQAEAVVAQDRHRLVTVWRRHPTGLRGRSGMTDDLSRLQRVGGVELANLPRVAGVAQVAFRQRRRRVAFRHHHQREIAVAIDDRPGNCGWGDRDAAARVGVGGTASGGGGVAHPATASASISTPQRRDIVQALGGDGRRGGMRRLERALSSAAAVLSNST